MRKNFIIIILIFIICLAIFFISINAKSANLSNKNVQSQANSFDDQNTTSKNVVSNKPAQQELSTFSTPLSGDEGRLNNIKLSCNTINGTKIKNGDTFSFNDIVGKPTAEKGYMEADVIIGTELTKGFGGGNCQVSTTLYNACINIEGIDIVERHPHKRKVAYVEEGKDASVSFGTLDLKFTNNTGKDITIYMDSENEQVTARIVAFI